MPEVLNDRLRELGRTQLSHVRQIVYPLALEESIRRKARGETDGRLSGGVRCGRRAGKVPVLQLRPNGRGVSLHLQAGFECGDREGGYDRAGQDRVSVRSEEHTSELQSRQ